MRVRIFITLYFYDSGGFAARAAFIKVVLEMQDAVKNISLGVSVYLYQNTEHRPTQWNIRAVFDVLVSGLMWLSSDVLSLRLRLQELINVIDLPECWSKIQ